MLSHSSISDFNQTKIPQMKRLKAIALQIITAVLVLLLASSCSDDKENAPTPVSKVSLPKNPTQDYDYQLNGVQIKDHYMWLNQKTPQRTQWFEQQSELSSEYFSRLNKAILDSEEAETIFNHRFPQQYLSKYFYIKENPTDQQGQIVVYDSIKEIETKLGVIPEGLTAVSTSLSPKGRLLAIQTQNRQNQFRWLIFDLATKQFNSYRLPATTLMTEFIWLTGYNRFVYHTDHQIYYLNLAQGPDFSQLLFDLNDHIKEAEQWHINSTLSLDSRYLVVTAKHLVEVSDLVWVIPIKQSGEMGQATNIAKNTRASLNFIGNINNTFYFHTNLVAPRWRVISINLKQPSRRDWKEVIPQQNELLISARLIENRWLLQYLDNTQQKLYLSQLNGSAKQAIKVTPNSELQIQSPTYMPNQELSLLLTVNTFEHPARIFPLDLNNRKLSDSFLPINKIPDIDTETVFYRSADGSRIPLTIAHHEDLSKDGGNPTLLITNQGFGHSQLPYYSPLFQDWLERGGVVAIAHIRGGGVYGESWRQSVSGQKHARAVEDIVAAIDWLTDKSYTSRKHVSAYGEGFAASLMMEAAIHAPQNFKALALKNIEADYLSFLETKDPFWSKEFMLNNDQASTEWFLAVSPYHRLTFKNYPAALIISDHKEPNVSHYKTLAKWQNLQLSKRPILLLNRDIANQIGGEKNFDLITQEAIKYFLSNELRATDNGQEPNHTQAQP